MPLHSSSEVFERHGIFLMDTGTDLYFYVCQAAHPELCTILFGRPYDQIVSGRILGVNGKNEYTNYVKKFSDYIINRPGSCYPNVWVIRESDAGAKMAFLSGCIEDRLGELYSYPQFLNFLRDQLAK